MCGEDDLGNIYAWKQRKIRSRAFHRRNAGLNQYTCRPKSRSFSLQGALPQPKAQPANSAIPKIAKPIGIQTPIAWNKIISACSFKESMTLTYIR